MAFFSVAVALLAAGPSLALTAAINSPPSGAWSPTSAVSVSGNASLPAEDHRVVSSASELANGSFNGTKQLPGGPITVVKGNDTILRYFDGFDYPDGTPVTQASAAWVSGDRLWQASNATVGALAHPPALMRASQYGGGDLFWRAVSPVPITSATLTFRYALWWQGDRFGISEGDGKGYRMTSFTTIFSAIQLSSETNVSIDLTPWVANTTSFFLGFAASGNRFAIDDLTVELEFPTTNASRTWSYVENFTDPTIAGWDLSEGTWYYGPYSALPQFSGNFLHPYNTTGSGYLKIYYPAAILAARLSFAYGCTANASFRAYASPAWLSNETELVNSSFGLNLSSLDVDLSPYVATNSLFLRFQVAPNTSLDSCGIDDFNLTLTMAGNPPSLVVGRYTSAVLDFGIVVNWTALAYAADLPALSQVALWLRTSQNASNWSAWSRQENGSAIPLAPARYAQFEATLWQVEPYGAPNLTSVTIGFFAITQVEVSADNGSSWALAAVTLGPRPGEVNWTANLTLQPGANSVVARVFDTTGANSSTNRTLYWDDFPPSAPGQPTSAGPFSNSTTLGWSWTAATDLGLGVVDYRVSVGTSPGASDVLANVSTGNLTNFTLSGVLNGTTYYLSALAEDGAGLFGNWSSPSAGILVDRSPPVCPKPARPGAWLNSSSLTWAWATAFEPGSGVQAYFVRIGTAPGASDIVADGAANGTSFTFNGAVHNGSYYLSVRALDRAGNLGAWSLPSDVVRVDMNPPGTPGGLGGPSGFANVTDAVWTWNRTSDDLSGIDHYEVTAGASPSASDIVPLQVALLPTATLLSLPDGTALYVRVRAVDLAGNSGNWSAPSAALMVDRALPLTPDFTTAPPAWSDVTTLAWAWGAGSDTYSGILGYRVRIGSSPDGSDVVGDTFLSAFSYTFAPAVQGHPYYVTLRAVDRAGNVGAPVTSTRSSVDLGPPPAPSLLQAPVSPTNLTELVWKWNPSLDAYSGTAAYLVSLGSAQGLSDIESRTVLNATEFHFAGASSGSRYFFSVGAVDAVGWRSPLLELTGPVTVDREPPTGVAFDPAPSASRLPGVPLTWKPATDSGGAGLDRYEIEIALNGSTYVVPVNRMSTAYTLSGQDGVRVTIRVRAVDGAENGGQWSPPDTVVFDFTPPTAPTGLQGSASGTRVTWTWTPSTDEASGVAGYRVTVGTSPGANDVADGELVTEAQYVHPGTPGQHYFITVAAVDLAGNEALTPGPTAGVVVPNTEAPRSPGFGSIEALTGVAAAAAVCLLARRRPK